MTETTFSSLLDSPERIERFRELLRLRNIELSEELLFVVERCLLPRHVNHFVQKLRTEPRAELLKLVRFEGVTPEALVNVLFDMLDPAVFRNRNTVFWDPAAKTGIPLKVAYERLMAGLAQEFPNPHERHNHIVGNMLVAFVDRRHAPTVRATVAFFNGNPACVQQVGIGSVELAMQQFLDERVLRGLADPNLIAVSNPPWKLYQRFLLAAKKAGAKTLLFVVPDTWTKIAGGSEFHEFLFSSQHLRLLRLLPKKETKRLFDVDLYGTSILLVDLDWIGSCSLQLGARVEDFAVPELAKEDVDLREFPVVLNAMEASIIRQIRRVAPETWNYWQVRQAFGLKKETKDVTQADQFTSDKTGIPCLRASRKGEVKGPKWDFARPDAVTRGIGADGSLNLLPMWKLCTAASVPGNGASPLRELIPCPAGACSTESFPPCFYALTEGEMIHAWEFSKTTLFRFLVSLRTIQGISSDSFGFVPVLDFSHKWGNDDLARYFKLTREQCAYIEARGN